MTHDELIALVPFRDKIEASLRGAHLFVIGWTNNLPEFSEGDVPDWDQVERIMLKHATHMSDISPPKPVIKPPVTKKVTPRPVSPKKAKVKKDVPHRNLRKGSLNI